MQPFVRTRVAPCTCKCFFACSHFTFKMCAFARIKAGSQFVSGSFYWSNKPLRMSWKCPKLLSENWDFLTLKYVSTETPTSSKLNLRLRVSPFSAWWVIIRRDCCVKQQTKTFSSFYRRHTLCLCHTKNKANRQPYHLDPNILLQLVCVRRFILSVSYF